MSSVLITLADNQLACLVTINIYYQFYHNTYQSCWLAKTCKILLLLLLSHPFPRVIGPPSTAYRPFLLINDNDNNNYKACQLIVGQVPTRPHRPFLLSSNICAGKSMVSGASMRMLLRQLQVHQDIAKVDHLEGDLK